MNASHNYVLVLNQQLDDLQVLRTYLGALNCAVVITDSAAQAVAQASQATPYLVILTGDLHEERFLAGELRRSSPTSSMTIVALADYNAPSWFHHEENPELDGFLVKPLTNDIVTSLVQSARARCEYHQTA